MSQQKEKKKAGRKPLPTGEKKIQLLIYPRQSDIEACGGIEKAREIAVKAIENYI